MHTDARVDYSITLITSGHVKYHWSDKPTELRCWRIRLLEVSSMFPYSVKLIKHFQISNFRLLFIFLNFNFILEIIQLESLYYTIIDLFNCYFVALTIEFSAS